MELRSRFFLMSLASNLILLNSSLIFADQRSFQFKNGSKVIYNFDSKDKAQYSFRIVDPLNGMALPDQHLDLNLQSIETQDETPQVNPDYLTIRRSSNFSSDFTWFETNSSRYLLFQDGKYSESCLTHKFKKISATEVKVGNDIYILESYQFDSTSGTYLKNINDSTCISFDLQFHNFQSEGTVASAKNKTVSILGGDTEFDLETSVKIITLTYKNEKYQIHTKNEEEVDAKSFGTRLIRLSDGKKIQVEYGPIAQRDDKEPLFKIVDGILSIQGLSRKIDLDQFNAESRRFNKIGIPDRVKSSKDKAIDVVTEVAESYQDLVAQSRAHPEEFQEQPDPVVIESIARAIRAKRSVALLGTPGTGKTSAIRAFARAVGEGLVPGLPRTTKIYSVKVANLGAGTRYIGTIEERISTLVAAAKATGCYYFFDELHSLAGTGTHKSQENDVTQFLKDPMQRGELILLGTDTDHEFHNAYAKDPAFVQRFKLVKVTAPIGDDLVSLVTKSIHSEHESIPPREIVQEAIRISDEYDLTTSQPRAAVNLLKEAYAALGSLGQEGDAPNIQLLRKAAIETYQFDPALFSKEVSRTRIATLRDQLRKSLIGQKHAITEIVKLWKRKLSSVGDPDQVNSLLFVGPPGVGKSKIAELSADYMGYQKTIIEMNKFTLLDGTEQFRREVYSSLLKNPYQVFILDEIENAAPHVQEAALSILQTGQFIVTEKTPSGGSVMRQVNAKHSLFLMTSNAASEWIRESGKPKSKMNGELFREKLQDAGISKKILSRIQGIVLMGRPSKKQFQKAVAKYLDSTLKRESEKHGAMFELENKSQFIESRTQFYHEEADYRDVKRLMKEIEDNIANAILDPRFEAGKRILIQWDESLQPEKKGKSYLSMYN